MLVTSDDGCLAARLGLQGSRQELRSDASANEQLARVSDGCTSPSGPTGDSRSCSPQSAGYSWAGFPDWHNRRREKCRDPVAGPSPESPALRVTVPPPHVVHAYYKYDTFVRPERLRPAGPGIGSSTRSMRAAFHVRSAHAPRSISKKRSRARPRGRLPGCRWRGRARRDEPQFRVHPTLTRQNMLETCAVVADVMGEASA
jgi:hypothetical protein